MQHRPHLNINDVAVGEFDGDGEYWYIHRDCPNAPKERMDRRHLISLNCYSVQEKLECDACERRFGKRALVWLKSQETFVFEFKSLENMQKFAEENNSKAYRAFAAFQPPKATKELTC